MSDTLRCPECPRCHSREQTLRLDTERDIGVVRCGDCDETMMLVAVVANTKLTTVVDPTAGDLPERALDRLREQGCLPPVAEDGGQA